MIGYEEALDVVHYPLIPFVTDGSFSRATSTDEVVDCVGMLLVLALVRVQSIKRYVTSWH